MAFFVYDIPIGSSFVYDGDVYKVVESPDDTCKGCSFEGYVMNALFIAQKNFVLIRKI